MSFITPHNINDPSNTIHNSSNIIVDDVYPSIYAQSINHFNQSPILTRQTNSRNKVIHIIIDAVYNIDAYF